MTSTFCLKIMIIKPCSIIKPLPAGHVVCFNNIRVTVKDLQKLNSYLCIFLAFTFIGLNLFLTNDINVKEKKKIRERPKGKKQTGPEVLCGALPK